MSKMSSLVVSRAPWNLGRGLARVVVVVLGMAGALGGGPVASAQTTAETDMFTADRNNLPISAKTTFNLPAWTQPPNDPTRTAQHELLHAIGFTVNYTLFANRVTNRPDGRRNFRDAGNNLLAILTDPTVVGGTHVDPGGGVVNGRNQNLSIMGPNNVFGQRVNQWEADILNAAFAWNTRNINIVVTFQGDGWDAARRTLVNDSVTAVRGVFGGNGTGHRFDWTVCIVPTPGAAGLALMGVLVIARRRRT